MLGMHECNHQSDGDRLEALAYLVQTTRQAQVLLPLTGHPRDRAHLKSLERVLDEAAASILANRRKESV